MTALQATMTDLNKHIPPKPDFGMAMKDNGKNDPQRVFVRGNINNQGDVVPRRFLTCLSIAGEKPLPPTGSGRLELARYITSIDNPLTARVFVNRVWLNHFGLTGSCEPQATSAYAAKSPRTPNCSIGYPTTSWSRTGP